MFAVVIHKWWTGIVLQVTQLGPLDCAWDEGISHTLVSVILSLLGMDFAPSSWDPQENDCSSGQRWQWVDPWWTDVCVDESVKCQFYSSRTTATGKQSTPNSNMGSLKARDVGTTEFRNEKLLVPLSVTASTGDQCVDGAGRMSSRASCCFPDSSYRDTFSSVISFPVSSSTLRIPQGQKLSLVFHLILLFSTMPRRIKITR